MTTLREEWVILLRKMANSASFATFPEACPWVERTVSTLLEAQRTADLEAIREGVETMIKRTGDPQGFDEGATLAKGRKEALSDTLSLIEQKRAVRLFM